MPNVKKEYDELLRILKSLHPDIDFSVEQDLWENGVFDSLELVQLIAMIEETFVFCFDEETLVPETFFSAETIWKVITKDCNAE